MNHINDLKVPIFLLNFPFTLDNKNPNNVWIKELDKEKSKINKKVAYKQFLDLYNYMAGDSLVYLLPSYGNFQDQVYVANLGIVPHHLKKPTVILSNYTSEPRRGEENVGKAFFKMMEYDVHMCPHKWEGEADLKWVSDNIYIGGYGIRSDIKSYKWMQDNFNMKIIPVKMEDEYLYHLDCSIFPIDSDSIIVGTDFFNKKELKSIEKYAEIIHVSEDSCYSGITNSVRFYNTILCSSNIHELNSKSEDYKLEKKKIAELEIIAANTGMECVFFNLSQFMLSGALLSCCVMHLNQESKRINLL